jgi:formylglycine-generating enzyme
MGLQAGHPVGPEDARISGMIFIPGQTFRMGSDKHYPEEAPVVAISAIASVA